MTQAGTALSPSLVTVATTIGAVAIGVAVVEAALIPGLVLGATAVLAPGFTARRLPGLRAGLRSLFPPPAAPARPARARPHPAKDLLPRLHVGEALAKTITFRLTVATLDFAWNYVILGEVVTAAGLSALNLAVGPVFYFLHEAVWNYGSPETPGDRSSLGALEILAPDHPGATTPQVKLRGIKLTRATAKTIVYETLGSTAEFTVNFIVVGDLVTAAIITAPFVILGPVIYYGHERAWEALTARTTAGRSTAETTSPKV